MEFESLLKEFMPLLCMPVIVCALSSIFKVVQIWIRGAYTADMADELEKRFNEQIREEEEKNYIDEDLKKYFNYKE